MQGSNVYKSHKLEGAKPQRADNTLRPLSKSRYEGARMPYRILFYPLSSVTSRFIDAPVTGAIAW
jgi:hypothetical protein